MYILNVRRYSNIPAIVYIPSVIKYPSNDTYPVFCDGVFFTITFHSCFYDMVDRPIV